MALTIIRQSSDQIKKWSGGTTTELFISPLGANYGDRTFDFRISTATVEVEESIFTPLLEVSRTLMVLEGDMRLEHIGHHSVNLSKFSVDRFHGGWETKSVGKCVDFNLMTLGKTKGDLEGKFLVKGEELIHQLINCKESFIYLFKGSVGIEIEGEAYTLHEGDFICLNEAKAKLIANSAVELVMVNID